MNIPHTIDCYKDGYLNVKFCKVCGAEGLTLLGSCPRTFVYEKNEKALDEKNLTVK
jgi:hypothetical protein